MQESSYTRRYWIQPSHRSARVCRIYCNGHCIFHGMVNGIKQLCNDFSWYSMGTSNLFLKFSRYAKKACVRKYMWLVGNINNCLYLARKYVWTLVHGHYLFPDNEEQIMFKDKYPSTFSPQMEAIVFIILQIFFAIGEYLTAIHLSVGG